MASSRMFSMVLTTLLGLALIVSSGCELPADDDDTDGDDDATGDDDDVLEFCDGQVAFREFIDVGVYVVADGVFDEFGGHGEQVFIGAHGAMVGTINCW